MIKYIEFIKNWRVFSTGDRIDFYSGVNLIVGDSACGKTSLLLLLAAYFSNRANAKGDAEKIVHIDSDDSPAFSFIAEQESHMPTFYTDPSGRHVSLPIKRKSHGEFLNDFTNSIGNPKNKKGMIWIADELDAALSIRSAKKMVKIFKSCESDCQIIASMNNPIVISAFPDVYSLEHRKSLSSISFIDSHCCDFNEPIVDKCIIKHIKKDRAINWGHCELLIKTSDNLIPVGTNIYHLDLDDQDERSKKHEKANFSIYLDDSELE